MLSSVPNVFASVFIRMLQVFQQFRIYVANLDVAHVVVWPTCHNLLLELLGHCACVRGAEGWSTSRRRVREA
jgi:hypothetical protein